jgi:hypothetical protein
VLRARAVDRGTWALEGEGCGVGYAGGGGCIFLFVEWMEGMRGGGMDQLSSLTLNFELGVLARVFEEVDVADHWECSDILICEFKVVR